jgi:hypothetical protein
MPNDQLLNLQLSLRRKTVRATAFTIFAAFLLSAGALTQVPNQNPHFLNRAEVRHGANSATVVANSPRPLEQAVQGVSEEYGWAVDFEDPPYFSSQDVVDATAPAWRAQHPTAKGVTLIKGGAFQSQFPEHPGAAPSIKDEEAILNKLVADYNQSGNPGKFSVRREGTDRFIIIPTVITDDAGATKEVRPILDTLISLPPQSRDGLATLQVILSELSSQSGTSVGPGLIPLNLLVRTNVVFGGQAVPARTLLRQVLSATGEKLYWKLLYDTDGKRYFLNLLPVQKAQYDAFGNRTTVLVK